MKAISEELKLALQQDVACLVMCWQVQLRSGETLRFTGCDHDVVVEGEVFCASIGVKASSFVHSARMKVDNAEMTVLLNHELMDGEDLLQGKWDGAKVDIFQCDALHPEWGRLHVKTGWIGQVRMADGVVQAELRGLSQRLQQQMGEVYSPRCRAMFCDSRCALDAQQWKVTGTVTEALSQSYFVDAARVETAGYFRHGVVTFTSGRNAGQAMEVKEFADGRFVFMLPLPYPIETGDEYFAIAGCDKQWNTCISRFSNALNFRGEPHVPGIDKMFETAATRSVW